MKLGSIRQLSGNRPVLKDTEALGPDPVYWVFSQVEDEKWHNVTIIAPGYYSGEYPKTFGHYHGAAVNEVYRLVSGEGVLVMQKKHLDQNGQHILEVVDEVYLIKAKPGDEILITPEWGHSWSNIGRLPLISFDNWTHGHSPSDYEPIEALQGMAYYLVEENGHPAPVPNPKYHNLPEPKWVTTEEFENR